MGRERLGKLLPGGHLVVRLDQTGALADHLAERPEADPVPVGGAAPVVPPDGLHEPIDVLEELPGEPALADAGRPDHRNESRPLFPAGHVEQVLEQAQLIVATDERSLQGLSSTTTPTLREDPERSPRWHGTGLALESLVPDLLERDRPRSRALGRLAHEDGPGDRDRLESARGVDEIAGDHPLIGRADGDCGLPGHDAGPGRDPRAERLDGIDELETGPHCPLGIVLVCGGSAPDRHDGVADEFLDRPAVATHHVPGEIEVAAQQVSGVLRVVSLGDRREAHEIREQDRDQPEFGDGSRASRGKPRPARRRLGGSAEERRGAFAAELLARLVGRAT